MLNSNTDFLSKVKPCFCLRFLFFGFSSNSTCFFALFADSTKLCKKFGFGSSGSDSFKRLRYLLRGFVVSTLANRSWRWWIRLFDSFFDSLDWFVSKDNVVLLFNHFWLLFVRLKWPNLLCRVKKNSRLKKQTKISRRIRFWSNYWSVGGGAHTGVR